MADKYKWSPKRPDNLLAAMLPDNTMACAECLTDTELDYHNTTPIFSTDAWFISDKCGRCHKIIER